VADFSSGEDLVQAGAMVAAPYAGTFVKARRCRSCGYIYFPTPSPRVVSDYYQNVYPQVSRSWYNIESDYNDWKTKARADRVIELAGRYGFGAPHSYHEIGCAFGGTVHEMNSRGLETTGTEANKRAVEEGRLRGNRHIFSEDTRMFLRRWPNKPNVVYGYHVLEHLTNPVRFLNELRSIVSPQAIFIFFIPNSLTLVPLVYGFLRYSWFAFPGHLHMYSPHSLSCLATATGCCLSEVASHVVPVHPAAADKALGHEETVVGKAVRDRTLADSLLAEELSFVLVPAGSEIAEAHRPEIAYQEERCRRQGAVENALLDLIKDKPIATPP
jgi:SAM-dependent methyltransferase